MLKENEGAQTEIQGPPVIYLEFSAFASFRSEIDPRPNWNALILLECVVAQVAPLNRAHAERAALEEWKGELDAEAVELKLEGEGFGPSDDPNEFDEWQSTSKKFLATVKDFVRWGTSEPVKAIEELKEVFESANRPREPDSDEDNEQQLPDSGPYWTIQRLLRFCRSRWVPLDKRRVAHWIPLTPSIGHGPMK